MLPPSAVFAFPAEKENGRPSQASDRIIKLESAERMATQRQPSGRRRLMVEFLAFVEAPDSE
jgi:hypothetical protein